MLKFYTRMTVILYRKEEIMLLTIKKKPKDLYRLTLDQ